jgi:SAM-dependent methyltransferase
MFEEIVANDVLEHIPDLISAMRNCRDLLIPNGKFIISVPYELSLGAWQDPTHVRAFNENSWLYYTDWCWYLGWDKGFKLTELQFKLTELGTEMSEAKFTDQEILRTPRAVDSMRVTLCKQ